VAPNEFPEYYGFFYFLDQLAKITGIFRRRWVWLSSWC